MYRVLNESIDDLLSTFFTKSELKAVFEELHRSAGPPEEICISMDFSNPSILFWSMDP
tara:strand:- start:155 stop:328 length:174 start_codon:yes stop_codon:yes gene_type:complete